MHTHPHLPTKTKSVRSDGATAVSCVPAPTCAVGAGDVLRRRDIRRSDAGSGALPSRAAGCRWVLLLLLAFALPFVAPLPLPLPLLLLRARLVFVDAGVRAIRPQGVGPAVGAVVLRRRFVELATPSSYTCRPLAGGVGVLGGEALRFGCLALLERRERVAGVVAATAGVDIEAAVAGSSSKASSPSTSSRAW